MIINHRGFFRFFFVLTFLLSATAFAGLCPPADLNADCIVDLDDVDEFVEQWLEEGECEGDEPCANFNGLNSVDFLDFSVLVDFWKKFGSSLVINEFMASNNSDSGISDPQGDFDDWIEIYNYGDTPINLAGMHLTDDLGNPTKWQFPAGYPSQTTVPADGFVVIWADEETADGPLHANFKLSADGEDIGLFDANGVLIDSISFGQQSTNIAYGRYPDATDNWRFFPIPTPAADNNGAYLGEIEEVEFSRTRGFYDSNFPFNLTLACVTSGVNIYYTTDGRSPIVGESPAPTSTLYTSQIPITTTKYIRAAAIKTGWMPTKVETHTYIFNASSFHKSLPIIAIVGDPTESLWAPNGIMCTSPTNRQTGYEKPVSIEVFDANSSDDYQIDCGIRIHGNARYDYTIGDDWLYCWYNWWDHQNMNKFGFRFYFRSEYGNNRFDFPLFPFEPEGEKKQCIVVRSGKNDSCTPFVKDEFSRRLFRFMGGVQVTGALVNLYINGVYKAYYNPVNRDNSQFFEEWYGTDNKFDVITQSGLRDGDTVAWDAFLNYIDTHDLSIPANYAYVASQLDIVQFIDFLIVEIHIGNFDWPNNNWTVHREKTANGIFRYSIWDAEGIEQWYFQSDCSKCADTAFDKFPSYETGPKGLNNGPWPICRIYRKLKANPYFKQLFADRIHKHYKNNGIMTTSSILTTWNNTVNEVKPVLPAYDGVLPPAFVGTVFLPRRENYVLAAFETNGLYSRTFGAPVFYVNSVYKFGGYVSSTDTFTITDPCSSGGTIYYTLDGNDPRTPFTGTVSTSAIQYTGGFTLNKSTNLRARIYKSSTQQWSPINEAVYGLTNVAQNLRITELMYNLADTGEPNDEDSEYVELKNIGSSTINLNLVSFDKGITFTFGPNTLAAGQHILVVKDINAFTTKYGAGRYIAGQYTGALANDGERIVLKDAIGRTILDFKYSDDWQDATDGEGFSLNILPSCVGHWRMDDYEATTTVADSSGNGHNGTAQQNTSALHTTGVIDGALTFNGTTDYVNLGTGVIGTGAYTKVAWVRREDAATGNNIISGNAYHALWAPHYTGYLYNYKLSAGHNNVYNKVQDTVPLDVNTWYMVAVTYDPDVNSGKMVLYKNGVEVNEATSVARPTAASTTYIGRYSSGYYFRGAIDNAMIFDRALPANEIAALYFDTSADSNTWGKKDSWRASAYKNGSPGWDDSGIIPNPGAIVINEVMAHSHAGNPDWIELRNTTASAINIGGWYLSDSDSNLMKYRFATGTTIPANGYIVVREDVNFGPSASDPGRLIPFALSENGDMVCLTSALDANSLLTGYREKEDFGASETGVTFGRYYKASTNSYNFVPMATVTQGSANGYPVVGPVVITEIMYHPDWPVTGNYANDEYEYIELRNTSGAAITLYDSVEGVPWRFTDGIDYTFASPPSTVTIPAGGRILVVKNLSAFNLRYPGLSSITYGPYSGWLANEGEQLELGKPGDIDEFGVRQYIRVERVNYSDGSHPGDNPNDPWPTQADGLGSSLTRSSTTLYGNDPNNWTAATPTPGL